MRSKSNPKAKGTTKSSPPKPKQGAKLPEPIIGQSGNFSISDDPFRDQAPSDQEPAVTGNPVTAELQAEPVLPDVELIPPVVGFLALCMWSRLNDVNGAPVIKELDHAGTYYTVHVREPEYDESEPAEKRIEPTIVVTAEHSFNSLQSWEYDIERFGSQAASLERKIEVQTLEISRLSDEADIADRKKQVAQMAVQIASIRKSIEVLEEKVANRKSQVWEFRKDASNLILLREL